MTSDAPSAEITHSIRVERSCRLFAASAYPARIVSLLGGVANVVGLWSDHSSALLLGWLGMLLLLTAAQFVLGRAYRRSMTAEAEPSSWELRFSLLNAPIGLLWAGLPLFAAPLTPPQDVLMGISLLAVMSTAVGSFGASAMAFYGFVAAPLLSLAGVYALRDTLVEALVAGLLLVCLAHLARGHGQAARRLVEGVKARARSETQLQQLRAADAAAGRSLAEHQQLFDLASIGILLMRNSRIVRVNPHLAQMLGYSQMQLVDQPTSLLCWNGGESSGDRAVRAALEHGLGASCEGDLELRRHDDRPLWAHLSTRLIDPNDNARGHIAVISDITDRRERDLVMQRLAHEDPLTGLPNRRLLQDRMQQAFVQAQRRGRLMAVLLVDLDGFRKINDNYGHEVGDDVLICVAQRLSGCVRGSDTVSRLGGDEFVVLLNDPGRGEDAQIVAEKLIESISTPIRSGSRTLFISASVGICMFPRDAQDAETMLRRADAAMYRAKQAGRGAWRLHPEAFGSSAG